jgi:hypothetical protein
MTTSHQALIARRVLMALRTHLRCEADLLVDAAHDLALDSRPSQGSRICRTCRPAWRTVLAGVLGSFINELIFRKERKIERIDQALERLDEGTYGICRECQSPIPATWLATLPYADRCAHCEMDRQTAQREEVARP